MDDLGQVIELPGIRARPMGSRGRRGDRVYWRARTTTTPRKMVWSGWATTAEATQILADLVRRTSSSNPSIPGSGTVRTVGDLLNAWMAYQEDRERGGQIAYDSLVSYRVWARYWMGAMSEVLLASLARQHVDDVLTGWRRRGDLSPRSCRNAVRAVSMALRWGADRGYCQQINLRALHAARVREDEHVHCAHTPTVDEVLAVLGGIPQCPGRDLVLLMWLTGARAGEVGALKVEHWIRAEGVLRLSGRDARRNKRGKVRPRRFPVDGELRTELGRLAGDREEGDLILDVPHGVAQHAGRVLQKACQAVGVPRFTSHGLRRRMVMDLLTETDHKTVSEMTGHSVHQLLTAYVRPSDETKASALARARAKRQRSGHVIAFPDGRDDEAG